MKVQIIQTMIAVITIFNISGCSFDQPSTETIIEPTIESSSTSTPEPTNHPTATNTPTPAPPTKTLTPTLIPILDQSFPLQMQVAILDPFVEENWEGNGYSIHKITRGGFWYIFKGPSIKVIEDASEYLDFRGIGWSPSGRYFIYATSNTINALRNWCSDICKGFDIWIISNDGTYQQMLSTETRLAYDSISWHSNETKFITFCPQSDPNNSNREICIVHIPEGKIEHTGNLGSTALFSPTGDSYIYSSSNEDRAYDYFLVQENEPFPTKFLTSIINFRSSDSPDFVWSPDGKYIYALQNVDIGSKTALFRISLDGTRERLVIPTSRKSVIQSISPNGLYILMCDLEAEQCEVFNTVESKLISLPKRESCSLFWLADNQIYIDQQVVNIEDGTNIFSPYGLGVQFNGGTLFFCSNLSGAKFSKLPE